MTTKRPEATLWISHPATNMWAAAKSVVWKALAVAMLATHRDALAIELGLRPMLRFDIGGEKATDEQMNEMGFYREQIVSITADDWEIDVPDLDYSRFDEGEAC